MLKMSQISLMTIVLFITACATDPYDYTALNASKPRSILVLPPVSDAVDLSSTYTFLSTISKPLAEKGYYVFPVAVIDTFLKENGLAQPEDMNAVPLDKLFENIGPDAVLYVHIKDWGQKYQVISSNTVVNSTARLVDARTGTLLWETNIALSQGSSNGGGGFAGMLVGALVQQVVGSKVDLTVGLSSSANTAAINNRQAGLLAGPYLNIE